LVVFSDIGGLQIGFFRTFGSNALAAYVIHGIVEDAVRQFAPRDSPLGWALGSFAIFAGITYLFVRHLEESGIYLRIYRDIFPDRPNEEKLISNSSPASGRSDILCRSEVIQDDLCAWPITSAFHSAFGICLI